MYTVKWFGNKQLRNCGSCNSKIFSNKYVENPRVNSIKSL